MNPDQVERVGQLLAVGLDRIDACYPDADAAAALRHPRPGPERDQCAARIRDDWTTRLTQSPATPSPGEGGHAVGAGGMGELSAPTATQKQAKTA